MLPVAVDAMGGDHAPGEIVAGAVQARDDLGIPVVLVGRPDELGDTARAWGHRLASGPTTALSLIKRQLDASDQLSFGDALEGEARAQHITYTTSDMMEGIASFLERRDARFTGK